MTVSLETKLGKLTLPGPLVAASGVCGFGEEFLALDGFDYAQLGAIVLKGTTREPRPGNPSPRIVETAAGLINSIGIENPGVERVVGEYLPRLAGRQLPCLVFANVAGRTVEEYVEVTRRFGEAEVIAAIELNFSCPNVVAGQALGGGAEACARALEAIRPVTDKPLFVKLPPNVPDVRPIVKAAVDAGADGISLVNTLPALALDIHTRAPRLGNVTGGLSGPAIKPAALFLVARAYEAARESGTPIIGLGGVCGAEDALEFILAGANAVGLGTWLLREPLGVGRILSGIRQHLAANGINRLEELVGAAWAPPA